jgi:hypothetical protein
VAARFFRRGNSWRLTAAQRASEFGDRETLSVLHSKHGNELATFWHAVFGHGLDCLTDVEAGYLSRVESVDAIRTRMAAAAELARRRGLSAIEVSARLSRAALISSLNAAGRPAALFCFLLALGMDAR